MRKSAAEVIRQLEMRVARLERQQTRTAQNGFKKESRYDDPKYGILLDGRNEYKSINIKNTLKSRFNPYVRFKSTIIYEDLDNYLSLNDDLPLVFPKMLMSDSIFIIPEVIAENIETYGPRLFTLRWHKRRSFNKAKTERGRWLGSKDDYFEDLDNFISGFITYLKKKHPSWKFKQNKGRHTNGFLIDTGDYFSKEEEKYVERQRQFDEEIDLL